jgi:predicted nicotinamide N-methyase
MTRGASIKLQGGLAVELGAGLGLPSVLAAKQGMQVVSTDGVESVLDLLRKNLQRNCPKVLSTLVEIWTPSHVRNVNHLFVISRIVFHRA